MKTSTFVALALTLGSACAQNTCPLSRRANVKRLQTACCNGGNSMGGPCHLTTCTKQCAKIYVPSFQNCGSTRIGQQLAKLPGASAFVSKCQSAMGGGGGGGGGKPCGMPDPSSPFGLPIECPTGQTCLPTMKCSGGGGGDGKFMTLKDKKCVSAVPCKRLTVAYKGWPVSRNNKRVCGESDNGFHSTGAKCYGGTNNKITNTDGWSHAENICYEAGGRLCTSRELKQGVPMHTGCAHDQQRVWSSTACQSSSGSMGHVSMIATGKAQCSADSTDHAVRCCADVNTANKPVCDPFAKGEIKSKQCSSAKTCKQLAHGNKRAWPARYGDSKVCGESDDGLGPGGKKQCYGRPGQQVSWAQAEHVCIGAGARMCTVEELKADETRGTGCNHDRIHVWSSDSTDCSSGHLAVVGATTTKKKSKCIPDSSTAAVRCCADTSISVPCQAKSAPPPPIAPAPPPGGSSKKCGTDPNNPFGAPKKCPRGMKCVKGHCKKSSGGGSGKACGMADPSNPFGGVVKCPGGQKCVNHRCWRDGGSSGGGGGGGAFKGWGKVSSHYCGRRQDFNKKYKTAAGAIAACKANWQCMAVSDAGCDGKGWYVTCSSGTGSPSRSGSCMHKKP